MQATLYKICYKTTQIYNVIYNSIADKGVESKIPLLLREYKAWTSAFYEHFIVIRNIQTCNIRLLYLFPKDR